MARKKTRSVDGGTENNDSPEKFESKGHCPHIVKGVDIGGLKKAWKKKEDVSCCVCRKRQISSAKKVLGVESDLWVCMNCGHLGCGNTRHDHGMDHFTTPRSDCHSVVALVDTWTLRCLQCRTDINLEVNAKAADAIAFVKKNLFGSTTCEDTIEDTASSNMGKIYVNPATLTDKKSKYRAIKELKIYPMLGLENLGNTCYLNSILQCLAQTPKFVKDLEVVCQSKSYFRLSGGDNLIHQDHGSHLPPLEGVLGEGGQLSKAVHKVLHHVRSGARLRKTGTATENPGEVIRLMKKLTNTFYIGEQHDSHELLRFLLEGLRTEDLKRYQRGILNAMSINTAAKEVLPKERECLKAYKNQAIQEKLAVERLFGGSFVSLLKCMECDTVTKSFESFMDISLPVESEKVKCVEKQAMTAEMRVSKYQQKKERKEKRVARRSKKKSRGMRLAGEMTSAPLQSKQSHSSESGTDSEADVEDNLDAENVTSAIQDSVHNSPQAAPLSDLLVSSQCEDYGINYREVSSENEKLYPYTEMLFGASRDGGCEQELEQKCDPRGCDYQGSAEQSVVKSCFIPESSPVIYGCSVPYGSGIPEQSPDEDFGSCEGGRGSPASSIEQGDWDEDDEVKKYNDTDLSEHILVEEVESSLQMNKDQDAIEIEPPEPFEFMCSDSFKEVPLSCDINSVNLTDSIYETLPGPAYSPSGKDSSCEDNVNVSTNGTDRKNNAKELITDTNHFVPDIFDADKQVIMNEALEVSGEEGVGGKAREELEKMIGISETQNNFSDTMDRSDGSASVWGITLAPPSELESVVYSLEHCLRQFFSEEVLSGPNKIGCTHCTHLKEGRDPKEEEKLIHTDALKQLLFMKLPEVLTIHLKRFEVSGTRMSKITRKITFPLELDVSPYTSAKLEAKQPQSAPCYHLYGVIEHSGHMSSGHYVAYVKVNEEPSSWGDSVDQVSAADKLILSDCQEKMLDDKIMFGASQNNKLVDKWYYVSDTYVKEVSIKDVLAVEAYILFYRQQI